ncbi:MAG: bis(5'-nucleosyl)-tetraphosphatase (symmetrical) YqeK [Firmicutes bacterium]|nr:bis(5'-nucleosyl)-tetraphosphatase (symmetrical) YqeK [Ezakiella sp.]MDD7761156.1 bis(5'-nucleosyl)-tetraphosphatase (symmetrical) YqeK [Bacillota bacterium]
MYDKERVIEYLKEHLEPYRVEHSIRVAKTAKKLAKQYGVDPDKAEKAGLLHDSGKWADKAAALKKVQEYGIILDGELKYEYNMVHGVLGVYIAKEEFGIYDKEILDAIRYHVTGRWDMNDLEKVVYIADKIEPGRSYEKVEIFRELAKKSLDKATKAILDDSIILLLKKNSFIAIDSIEARNYFIVRSEI